VQIFPTNYRARGLNFAASGGAIGSITVAQVWPVGIANIGSKVYFIFMAINLVCIPIVYLFYPETKHLSLEEIDALFNKKARAVMDVPDVPDVPDDHVRKNLGATTREV
jgi:hypothetical protein